MIVRWNNQIWSCIEKPAKNSRARGGVT